MSTNRRVLLKLSGEAFGGGAIGLDPKVVRSIAEQVATAVREGVQVAIVVGGGNFFRGAQLAREGLERSRADYMGMLGTVMNALALQDFIDQSGIPARVQTAITMAQVAEPTFRFERFVTSKRAASSSLVQVRDSLTSPRIPFPPSVPSRSTATSSSLRRTAWTASTMTIRTRIPMPTDSTR